MNNHFMGMRGYTYVYGTEPSGWPCAEFSSYKDKWGKKAIVVPAGTEKSYVTRKDASWYKGAAVKVANHYTGPVGISYGICSALTFKATELRYQLEAGYNVANTLKLYERTLAVVWRLLYEGLGLAGYSANAKKFFDILNVAVWKSHYAVNAAGEIIRPGKDVLKQDQIECIPVLVELMGLTHLNPAIAVEIVRAMLEAERVRQNRGALERGKARVEYMSQHDVHNTAILTGLRAIGQGRNDGGLKALEASLDMDEVSDDTISPQSLFSIILDNKLTLTMSCTWLAELLQAGAEIHTQVSNLVWQAKQIEEDYLG